MFLCVKQNRFKPACASGRSICDTASAFQARQTYSFYRALDDCHLNDRLASKVHSENPGGFLADCLLVIRCGPSNTRSYNLAFVVPVSKTGTMIVVRPYQTFGLQSVDPSPMKTARLSEIGTYCARCALAATARRGAPKDHPLSPIYAKVTAEWQVDHWRFEPVEGNTSNGLLNAGKLRSEFSGPTMAKGSPERRRPSAVCARCDHPS